ncbi:extracellular matrix regulator RemB [Sutcliffiella halmapala]|uniref:extracellular matrix regulator RemB n=1 Tax=Sutcliffiella halmapala TaxID=79882 RepID=UPI000995D26E|nr:extracellular matrix/biofilm biosynthesis regulator RemA family protein [Sutcliffiella halmapala]
MYLHIGEEVMVRASNIIAILDRRLLKSNWQSNLPTAATNTIKNISKHDVKSVVITDEIIYFSPLASTTLKKRMDTSLEEIFLKI